VIASATILPGMVVMAAVIRTGQASTTMVIAQVITSLTTPTDLTTRMPKTFVTSVDLASWRRRHPSKPRHCQRPRHLRHRSLQSVSIELLPHRDRSSSKCYAQSRPHKLCVMIVISPGAVAEGGLWRRPSGGGAVAVQGSPKGPVLAQPLPQVRFRASFGRHLATCSRPGFGSIFARCEHTALLFVRSLPLWR